MEGQDDANKVYMRGKKNRKRPAVCGQRGKVNKVYNVDFVCVPVMETELLTNAAEKGLRYFFVVLLIG